MTDKHFVRRPVTRAASSRFTERAAYTETEFGQRCCQYLRGTDMRSTDTMDKPKIQTRRILSLKERIDVIRLAETTRDTQQLARLFDCGRTQILSILQQKERLLKEFLVGDPNRLRRRPSAFAVAINKLVAEWIRRARAAQISLTDAMIIERAYQSKKFMKYNEFRPNKRWLDRFKRRFRLEAIDLETPDPSLNVGTVQSLKLSDIFKDIKDTLDKSFQDAMTDREADVDYQLFLMDEGNGDDSSLVEHANSSNNERSEVEDYDDLTCQLESFCEAEIAEEADNAITTDDQALECIKRLEEYSMLKRNYRAIGLITQLEQLYKGQIEA